MSVAEISQLHARYVRLTDRFKSMWTYHQFASGVFKNLVKAALPYKIEFQSTFDRMKATSATLNASQVQEATTALRLCELALERAAVELLRADEQITASVLRRFFEKLKRQDETIVHQLIKFYLYTESLEGEHRDKLDYLFTRIGENFIAERGEYDSRDSLEFRERVITLVGLLPQSDAPQDEVMRLIRAVHAVRDDIRSARAFEDLTEKHLLKNARMFKHRLGNLYFHPDILMAIIELNVAAKNKFLRLYADDEDRIVDDSRKLVEHGPAIERNFGEKNPELVSEIARFRDFKERFDAGRADSNVKHDVVTRLKQSMTSILAQLDRTLGFEEDGSGDLPPAFFTDVERVESIRGRFGYDGTLEPFLLQIATALDFLDPAAMPEEIAEMPSVHELRLEPWEIAAYQKLFSRRSAEGDEDHEDLWTLFLRAAALRLRIDKEARALAIAINSGVAPDDALIARARSSLDVAKEVDERFNRFLHDAAYSNPSILHQLYRSRFRLLRGFSGLWLIFDRGGRGKS